MQWSKQIKILRNIINVRKVGRGRGIIRYKPGEPGRLGVSVSRHHTVGAGELPGEGRS